MFHVGHEGGQRLRIDWIAPDTRLGIVLLLTPSAAGLLVCAEVEGGTRPTPRQIRGLFIDVHGGVAIR